MPVVFPLSRAAAESVAGPFAARGWWQSVARRPSSTPERPARRASGAPECR